MKKIWLKRSALALAFLVTLVALFYAEEDWRGARELARVKKELEARGEPLDITQFVPPPIPDELNIAAAPIFAELYAKGPAHEHDARIYALLNDFSVMRRDVHSPSLAGMPSSHPPSLVAWQKWLGRPENPATAATDVLAATEKYRPTIEEIREAFTRPGLRWPVVWNKPFTERMPYLQPSMILARVLYLRALAEAETGQGEAALQDLALLMRLNEVMGKGVLVNYLVAISMNGYIYGTVADGLERRIWDEAQLHRISELLNRSRPLVAFQDAIRQERLDTMRFHELMPGDQFRFVMASASADASRKPSQGERAWTAFYGMRPRGWSKFDEADSIRIIQEGVIDLVDEERGRVDVQRNKEIELRMKKGRSLWQSFTRPFSGFYFPAIKSTLEKAAQAQAQLTEARTVCALELFRMKNKALPETLAALVPDFLPALPLDPIDGQPLRYRKEGEDYVLYSIGWDNQDDRGIIDNASKGRQGDWPWASRPALYQFTPEKAPQAAPAPR